MGPHEPIEKALRKDMRIRPQERAVAALKVGQPIPLSGGEAEDAARIAADALAGAGLVVVSAEDYRHVLDRAEQWAMHRFDADDSILVARLRAALPERNDHA